MPDKKTVYTAELLCEFAQWWRYNVYMIVVGYDSAGQRVSFDHLSDKVYDALFDASSRTIPPDYDPRRKISLSSEPCAWAEAYVYIVANTFPASPVIKESPPFEVTLVTNASGAEIGRESYQVNQWGGLTIVAKRMEL